jgi:hypothetical protein
VSGRITLTGRGIRSRMLITEERLFRGTGVDELAPG